MTSALATLAGLVLGAVFLASGASKLVGREQWRRAALEFGAPRLLVPVLPWVELMLGALLLVGGATPLIPVLALLVLAVFTVAIARKLDAGEHPECACFGGWSTAPLSRWHLVRNAGLMALAVLAMF
jgi:uncharacterized membrane protein YphA (DoxX/SURF4 family)